MKVGKYTASLILLFAAALLISVSACASGQQGGGGRGGMQGPPPEAIEACQDKAEGDTVSFSGRGGESISATCQMINDQLVAVPEGHTPPGQ